MKSFFDKDSYSQADIEQLIQFKAEESIYLDFKAAGSLDRADGKKKEIAKDVSAFANSAGGIIVYGLAEENYVATELSFVNANEYPKEWLEQVINSNIQQRIEGILIYPIHFEDDMSKTVYIVKIPASTQTPHMANKRYYKRFNFQSVEMEEYEVRDLYNRKARTELDILGIETRSFSNEDYLLKIFIKNISPRIEERYKVEVRLAKKLIGNTLTKSAYETSDKREEGNGEWVISFPNQSPLFQEEKTMLGDIPIRVWKGSFYSYREAVLHVRLYYSNGIRERAFNLLDYLRDEKGILLKDLWNITFE